MNVPVRGTGGALAAGFGSGMGTMKGTCGALVGASMVAGLRTSGNGTMALSCKMLPCFKELCGGATICRDLKGIGTGKVLCSCENYVRNAVLAAAHPGTVRTAHFAITGTSSAIDVHGSFR